MKDFLYDILDRTLSSCNYYTMARVTSSNESLTRFANSEIHQNVAKENLLVDIRVYHGGRVSHIITNDINPQGLGFAVKEAEKNLVLMQASSLEVTRLSRPMEICSGNHNEKLNAIFNEINRVEYIRQGIELLDSDYTAAGSLGLNGIHLAMGSSLGVRRYGVLEEVSLGILVTHREGSTGFVKLRSSNVEDIDVLSGFKEAWQKARMGIKSISIEPGNYDVILEPMALGSLIGTMKDYAFSAKNIDNGRSFLAGRLGERVFGENITLNDDIRSPHTMGLAFDFEGFPKKSLNLIDRGVLRDMVHDSESALKTGVETTGHSRQSGDAAPENLIMDGGIDTIEGLIERTKRGIWVSRFYYMNKVNMSQGIFTGMTRDGTFLVEDGEIKCGIRNLRFTESVIKALNNVSGITAQRRKVPDGMGVMYLPGVKIKDFHFSSKS